MSNIKIAKFTSTDDCDKVCNNCEECPLKLNCDYPFVQYIVRKYDELLGVILPIELKASMRKKSMLIVGNNEGLCDFTLSTKPYPHVTVSHIVVEESARGKGYAKEMINYLLETYQVPIIATCIADTSAENFWRNVGVKTRETVSRKNRKLSVYEVKPKIKSLWD